jgi:hypothetical protein
MENVDPKLDFGAMQRHMENRLKDRNAHRSEPKVRLPTGAPVDLKTALQARGLQQTELTLRAPGDPLPVRANSSRKRADFAWLDERGDKRDDKLRKSVHLLSTHLPTLLTCHRPPQTPRPPNGCAWSARSKSHHTHRPVHRQQYALRADLGAYETTSRNTFSPALRAGP